MHGLTASGKSILAKRLSKKLGADLYHSAIIRRELNINPDFSFLIEDTKFMKEVSPKVYSEMMRRAKASLKKGKDVILDGSFCMIWERETAYSLAKEMGEEIVILHCFCNDINEIKRRMEERKRNETPLSEAKDIRTYYSLKERGDPIEEHRDKISLVKVDTKWWKASIEGPKPPPTLIQTLDLDKAVFFDRDGTINKEPTQYVSSPEELKIIKGSGEIIRKLRKHGWKIIVVTNQSHINRGNLDIKTVESIHSKLVYSLEKEGAYLDAIYFCPHSEQDGCSCRKPKPGLFLKAIEEFNLNPQKCWIVGNKNSDLKAGSSMGIKGIKIRTDEGIRRAVDIILESEDCF